MVVNFISLSLISLSQIIKKGLFEDFQIDVIRRFRRLSRPFSYFGIIFLAFDHLYFFIWVRTLFENGINNFQNDLVFKVFSGFLFLSKNNIQIFLNLRSEGLDKVIQTFFVSDFINGQFLNLIYESALNKGLDSLLAINEEFVSFKIVTKVIEPFNFVRDSF